MGRDLQSALAAVLLLLSAPAAGLAQQSGPGERDYGKVGYARIDGVIDRMRHRYLQRVVKTAAKRNLDTLIVHIDTDGGEVFYAREMLKLILDQPRDRPAMIAFVDFRAISAGAMLAYGHEAVYISDTATIGDIGVIFRKPGGGIEYAPEKIETVVRALLTQASEKRGWSKGLLLKMTARNQKLYRAAPPDGAAEYVIEDDLPDFLSRHPDIDPDDHVILYRGENRLLTLTGREAVELGMATALTADLDALYRELGVERSRVIDIGPSTMETAAWFLSSLAPLLAGLALLFIVFEIKTPGLGLWALLGAVCGALFLLSQYFLDMASHLEVALIALGVALLAAELLTMAGGGWLGLVGAALMFAGLVLVFAPNEFQFDPGDRRYLEALGHAAVRGLIAIGVTALGILAFIVAAPRSRIGRRLSMREEIGATSAGALEQAADALVGRRGIARAQLCPGGIVVIAGDEYGARAEHGEFIDAGAAVEVVAAQFGELVVRPGAAAVEQNSAG